MQLYDIVPLKYYYSWIELCPGQGKHKISNLFMSANFRNAYIFEIQCLCPVRNTYKATN